MKTALTYMYFLLVKYLVPESIMCCVPFQSVHSQEIERLGGLLRDAPKPFHFRDGGGDLLVQLTAYHRGWTNTSGDQKV